MHKFAASLVGFAAVGASLLALRPPRANAPSATASRTPPVAKGIPAGETIPAQISLERLRELGL